ncbi:hypothetical protein HYU14_01790 [Candidatus Woesearchaeota archaeon]|nr:hypothetical protein [Candidatus Woesearchaeota archaeon]
MASRAYNLEEFIRILDGWGLRDVMLPFLLVFVVIFAALQRVKVFGDGKDKLNLTVALVMGLFVVIPHVTGLYPENMDPVQIINDSIPSISIVAVAAIGALLIIGLLGGQVENKPMYATGGVVLTAATVYALSAYPSLSPLMIGILISLLIINFFTSGSTMETFVQGAITIIAFLIVLFVFGTERGWFRELPDWLTDPTYQGVIIFVLIIVTLVSYVFSSGGEGKAEGSHGGEHH